MAGLRFIRSISCLVKWNVHIHISFLRPFDVVCGCVISTAVVPADDTEPLAAADAGVATAGAGVGRRVSLATMRYSLCVWLTSAATRMVASVCRSCDGRVCGRPRLACAQQLMNTNNALASITPA